MIRTIWLVAAVLLTATASARAQEPLTFDRAAALTLAHNPSIRAARAADDRAAADAAGVRAGWFPRVSFSESVRRGNQPGFVFSSRLSARRFEAADFAVDTLNHPAALTLFQRTVSVDQPLFDFGRTKAESHVAARRHDSADAAIRRTEASLVVDVANAYGRMLTATSSVRATGSAVAAAEEDLARAGHRRDAGTATDADVLSMRAHLSSMRLRAIQAAENVTIARAELNRLMGAPVDAQFDVVEPILPPPGVEDTAVLLAEAERSRPEMAMAQAARAIAEAETQSAHAGWFPYVSAQAGAEHDGLAFGDRALTWTAAIDVRWSLSIGGAEAARVRGAVADRARAEAEWDDAKAGVDGDVVAAIARAQSARARIEASRSAVDEARESQRIIRDRYDAGLAAITDVLRAATAWLDAETARVSAVSDALVARAALDRAVGRTARSPQ